MARRVDTVLLGPGRNPKVGTYDKPSHDLLTTTLLAVLMAAAPSSAWANSLLSGYGGPGEGSQTILGSALLGGGGGSSGGTSGSTGSSSSGAAAVGGKITTPSGSQRSGASRPVWEVGGRWQIWLAERERGGIRRRCSRVYPPCTRAARRHRPQELRKHWACPARISDTFCWRLGCWPSPAWSRGGWHGRLAPEACSG